MPLCCPSSKITTEKTGQYLEILFFFNKTFLKFLQSILSVRYFWISHMLWMYMIYIETLQFSSFYKSGQDDQLTFKKRKWKWSHSVLSHFLWAYGFYPTRLLLPWDFPGKNPLEGFAISFSRRSSWPRNWTWVSLIVNRHFTTWAITEVQAEINSASTCFFTCGPPSIILHKLLNELKETKRNHSNKSLKPLGLNILQCFPEPQLVNNLPALREIWVRCLCWEDTLEKRTATPMLWPGEFHGLYSPWVAKSQTWLSDFH